MKPAPFEYDDPRSVDETIRLLAKYGDDCKLLAGGQSLVPLMNFRLARPGRLVDINGVESLGQIKVENGRLLLGAMVRHAHVEHSNDIAARWPLLHDAIGWVGHSQIRNRGTVGGSVAHADPAAELPCALAALDAKFHVLSKRGPRVLRWDQIFVSEFTTSLAPDELLTAIEVPPQEPSTGVAFVEFARRHGDFALGGAAVSIQLARNGTCSDIAIALLSAGPRPLRAEEAERRLKGNHVDEAAIKQASAAAVEGAHPTSDLHGSREYRVKLLQVMTERALTKAVQRATRLVA